MKNDPLQVNAKRYLRAGIGLAASAITLYLALRNVSFPAVADSLARMDLLFGGLAFASVAVNTLAKTYRWQVLLGQAGKKITIGRLTMIVLAGQALNTLSPIRIGDLTRVVAIGRIGLGYFFAFGTILVEKVLDSVCYFLLFVLLITQIPVLAGRSGPGLPFLISLLLAAGVVYLFAYRQDWLLTRLDRLAGRFSTTVRWNTAGSLREAMSGTGALKTRQGLVELFIWTSLSWGTALLNVSLVLAALKIHVPWTASLALLVLLQAGISIPSLPGRIGVFEYICVLALAFFGVDQATAFGFGIVLHIVVLLPSTLLGLLFLWTLGLGGKIEPDVNGVEAPPPGIETSAGKL